MIKRLLCITSTIALGICACGAPTGNTVDDSTGEGATLREVDESQAAGSAEPREVRGEPALGPPRCASHAVLVHGSFADGSSWSGVVGALQRKAFTVTAVQLPEQNLADDAAIVRHALGKIAGPVVVAAHSYGGAVMSEATAGAANVRALVYVAAFALDEGETIGALTEAFPPTPTLQNLVIDDQGNATIPEDVFVRHFASDLPRAKARVLSAVQQPIAASILGTPAGPPGWKSFPSYYQVSASDEVIHPDLERFFARRMGATTIELTASHVSMISRPSTIARLIERAAACQPR